MRVILSFCFDCSQVVGKMLVSLSRNRIVGLGLVFVLNELGLVQDLGMGKFRDGWDGDIIG